MLGSIRNCAVAMCIALAGAVVVAPPGAAASETIRVATYNICAEKCGGLEAWSTRSARVVGSINYHQSDVLLVQEAGTTDYHARILKKRLASVGYAAATGTHARYIFYRTATMSVRTPGGSRLSGGTTTVQGTSTSRVQYVPWHLLRKRGTHSYTLFADMHLTVGKSDATDKVRLAEISKMWSKLASRESSYRTIWGGDFNSLAEDADPQTKRCGSWEYRWRVDAFLQSKGYLDSVFTAKSLLTPAISTVNANPIRATYDCAGQQIDHLYTDARLNVLNWRTVNRDLPYEQQYSDHDMVIATFTR